MPDRPNKKEDAEFSFSSPSKPAPTVSEHDMMMNWLKKNMSYQDPKTGQMYFRDNWSTTWNGKPYYPDGSPADGLPWDIGTNNPNPNPISSTLSGRYMVDEPVKPVLGNRWADPAPVVQALKMGVYPDQFIIELAKKAGYLK